MGCAGDSIMWTILAQLEAANAAAEADRLAELKFEANLMNLPVGDQIALRTQREDKKEKDRIEAKQERQHRELCEALRASGKTEIIKEYSTSYSGNNTASNGIALGLGVAVGMIIDQIN